MAHHDEDPDLGWDLGQLNRTLRAITALLHHLARDPRVQAAFTTWATTRGIGMSRERFERIRTGAADDRDRVIRASQQDPDEARAMLTAVARDLNLSFSWTPEILLWMFQGWIEQFENLQPPRVPSLYPDAQAEAELPTGRAPRETLARDVEWYYRARVKHPADKPAAMMREYKRAHPGSTARDSLIVNAIDRVHEWLTHPIDLEFIRGTRQSGTGKAHF